MKQFYVTSLIVEEDLKQNMRDTVEAEDREDASAIVKAKYISMGYEIIKQKVLEL
jgi:hypothetical protein